MRIIKSLCSIGYIHRSRIPRLRVRHTVRTLLHLGTTEIWEVCTNREPLPKSTPGITMAMDNGLAYKAGREV